MGRSVNANNTSDTKGNTTAFTMPPRGGKSINPEIELLIAEVSRSNPMLMPASMPSLMPGILRPPVRKLVDVAS